MFTERLDHYLVRVGFVASRRSACELIERGAVRVNGHRSRKGDRVTSDDRVDVEASDPRKIGIDPNPDLPIAILYDDPSMLIVNKPGLVPCHPLRSTERDTVMNAIVARFPETARVGEKPLEGGLVHRLDNGTSGALIIARTPEAFSKLRGAIRQGAVARRYRALVAGYLDRRRELQSPIAHHAKNPRRMMIGEAGSGNRKRAGRAAATIVEPIRRVGPFTLVSAIPRTGLRHQIRVHLANVGFPIVGDVLYRGPSAADLPRGRFWLHLEELEIDAPAGGRAVVKAPLPPDLKAALRAAR